MSTHHWHTDGRTDGRPERHARTGHGRHRAGAGAGAGADGSLRVEPGTSPRPGGRALLVVAVVAVLVPLAAALVAVLRDVPLLHVVDDPSVTTGSSPWTGALSSLGILAWWTGASVALFAAALVRRAHGDGALARFLLVGGLWTVYLAADDLFLFHDAALTPTPVPQPAFLAVMVLGFAWYLWAFRDVVRHSSRAPLVVAGVLFAGSLGADFVSDLGHYLDAWDTAGAWTFVEDSLKWCAIVAWTTYLVRVAADAVLDVTASRPAAPRG